jgi:hypothetical protein
MGYDYIVRGIREKKPSGLLLGGRDEDQPKIKLDDIGAPW